MSRSRAHLQLVPSRHPYRARPGNSESSPHRGVDWDDLCAARGIAIGLAFCFAFIWLPALLISGFVWGW